MMSRGKLGSCFVYIARIFVGSYNVNYSAVQFYSVSVLSSIHLYYHNSDYSSNNYGSQQSESYIICSSHLIL